MYVGVESKGEGHRWSDGRGVPAAWWARGPPRGAAGEVVALRKDLFALDVVTNTTPNMTAKYLGAVCQFSIERKGFEI